MTIEQKMAGIDSQYREIVALIGNKTLHHLAVKRALQDIIEGKLPLVHWNPPIWWRSPEQQLVRARQLWPNTVLPEPPKEFRPRTKSEVLLLHVPDTFDSLWDKVDVPADYTKYREEDVKGDERNLRLAPNKREYAEPVWLAFDHAHGKGERPDSFSSWDDIAASEVFSALIQFPEWSRAWNRFSTPCLAGYQLNIEGHWIYVPYIHRRGFNRRVELSGMWSDTLSGDYSFPTVREC